MNRKTVFIVSIALILLCSIRPVAAQEESPEILANKILVSFPDSITFSLIARSSEDIEQVILLYGTEGLTCQDGGARQLIEAFDPRVITAIWEWELGRSGALPPGTTIWWEWQLKTAAGETITLERQQETIQDEGPDWQTTQNDKVTVHWYRGDAAFGRAMLDESTQSLERISADLGVEVPDDVELWFYPSSQAVREAIINVPEWTGGVAFPEYNITVLGVDYDEIEWAQQIIPHELTHLVVGRRFFNCQGVRLPTWLSEGLARYAEPEISEAALREMESAFSADRVPTLRSLSNGFSAYSNAANMAYTQSYLVVAFLVEEFGAEQMDLLLTTMRDGQLIDEALLSVYGFDTDGLDVAWRTSRGFTPTATPEVDGLALQATVTPIPTLSLGGVPVAQPSNTPEPTVTATSTAVPTEAVISTATPTATAEATQIAAVTAEPTAPSENSAAETNILPTQNDEQPPWLLWGSIGALLLIVPLLYLLLKRS